MKNSIFTICLFFISLSMSAQFMGLQDKIESDSTTIFSGMRVNAHFADLSDFNRSLTNSNFANLAAQGTDLEVYFRSVRSNSRLDGLTSIGYHFRQTVNRNARNQVSLSGLNINLESGYDLIGNPNIHIRPFVGIGFSTNKLSFVENYQGPSLETVINSDTEFFSATTIDIPVIFGLDIGTTFKLKKTWIELGVQAGYKLYTDGDSWSLNGVVDFDETIDLSSTFAGFHIGLHLDR